MIRLVKKKKIDYEAIALFVMAKKHNKKLNEYIKALYQHFNISEDDESDIDLWSPTLEDESQEEMFETVRKGKLELKKKQVRKHKKV